MEIRLLGPLEVSDGGRVLDVGGPKQRAVLAVLATRVNSVVSVDRLIDLLWGDEPPTRAMGTLHAYVSNLRRILEPTRQPRAAPQLLVTRSAGYVLQLDEELIDASRFERRLAEAGRLFAVGDAARAVAALRTGLALWRGPALADLSFAEFARDEAVRLDELRLVALELRAAAEIELGHHAAVIAELEQLVRGYPLREHLWELLMVALYRAGRQGDALRAFQAARSALADELGVAPGPALRALEQEVLQHAPRLAVPPTLLHQRNGQAVVRPASGEALAPGGAPCVGRDDVLAVLSSGLAAAMRAGPRAIIVSGDAGVGKTRVVEELAHRARAEGMTVAWVRCSQHSGAPPLWPWNRLLTSIFDADGSPSVDEVVRDARDDLSRILPQLGDHPGPRALTSDDANAERFRLADSLSRVLARSSSAGLLVVVDDAQWMDVDSARILHFVVTERRPTAMLVVVITRQPDGSAASSGALDQIASIAAESRATTVKLTGLDRDAVDELITATVGARAPSWLVDVVHRRTDGNPLFVTEMARMLASSGGVEGRSPHDDLGVPPHVESLVLQRFERLPEDVRTLARIAAVIGDEFEVDVLSSVARLSTDRTLDLLEIAYVTGMLEEPDEHGRHRFSHGLVRDVLYRSLTPVQRARLHAGVVDAMRERHAPDIRPVLGELAFHAAKGAEAGTAEQAVELGERAARDAVDRAAYEQAVAHWRGALRGLELCRAVPAERRFEMLMGLSHAQRCSGDIAGSRATLNQAIEIVAESGDEQGFARAAIDFSEGSGAMWSWRGYGSVDAAALSLLERALSKLPAEDSPLRVHVLSALAVELYYADQRERCTHLSAAAIAAAQRLGSPDLMAMAVNMHYLVSGSPGDVPRRITLADDLIRLADCGARPEHGVVGRVYRMVSQLERGAPIEGSEEDEVRRLASRLRQPALMAQVAWFAAMRTLLKGELDEADRLSEEAFELHRRTSLWGAFECYGTQLFSIRRDQGRVGELEPLLTDLAATSPFVGFREGAALMYVDLGRFDDATRVLGDRVQFPDMPRDWSWLFLTCLQAEVCSAIGSPADCRRLLGELAPHAGRVAMIGTGIACWGPVSYFAGRLATAAGDDAAGEVYQRSAIATSGALGAPAWEVRAKVALAELLVRTGRAEDLDEPVQLLKSGAEIAEQHHMPALHAQATTIRARARGGSRRLQVRRPADRRR